jgi:hypothetical protein
MGEVMKRERDMTDAELVAAYRKTLAERERAVAWHDKAVGTISLRRQELLLGKRGVEVSPSRWTRPGRRRRDWTSGASTFVVSVGPPTSQPAVVASSAPDGGELLDRVERRLQAYMSR